MLELKHDVLTAVFVACLLSGLSALSRSPDDSQQELLPTAMPVDTDKSTHRVITMNQFEKADILMPASILKTERITVHELI